jgi:hypothetical protein
MLSILLIGAMVSWRNLDQRAYHPVMSLFFPLSLLFLPLMFIFPILLMTNPLPWIAALLVYVLLFVLAFRELRVSVRKQQ